MGRVRKRKERRRWSRPRRALTGALVAFLALAGLSYARALTFPGTASFSVRTVEWVRDHGGSPAVDAVENWYYARQAPQAAGGPQDALAPPAAATGNGHHPAPATLPSPAPVVQMLAQTKPMAGEGVWRPLGANGRLWQTWVRPDARHLPVVAVAVLVPRGAAVLHLSAGTREPVTGLATSAQVPDAARAGLLAVFNSGFKMRDSHGGWQLAGHSSVALRPGRASLVLTRGGGWRVGTWGQDVGPAQDVTAVRQNLDLVVRDGQAVPGLTSNAAGRWGTAHTQFQYTWRSGVGVDRAGDLLYVAGRSMTLSTFAQAMARLGVYQGMQMDIHTNMVCFNVVQRRSGTRLVMARLLPSMASSGRRYLRPDQRDFLYLTGPGH